MSLTEIYTSRNSIFIVGKVRDVQLQLTQLACKYKTVRELINARLS